MRFSGSCVKREKVGQSRECRTEDNETLVKNEDHSCRLSSKNKRKSECRGVNEWEREREGVREGESKEVLPVAEQAAFAYFLRGLGIWRGSGSLPTARPASAA